MNRIKLEPGVGTAFPTLIFGATLMVVATALRAQPSHLVVPQEGGMPGMPVMQQIKSVGTNAVEVQWDGPSGLYRLMRKQSLSQSQWQQVGSWTPSLARVVTATQSQEFYRVIGPVPNYAGSQSCEECHPDVHESEMDTRHAIALETLKRIGQGNNGACLPCHTVGYQLPTGFTTEAATPHLAGVQCENCHGPAANHVADPFDLTVRPRVEIAGQMCGGCHNGSHHPTYDEWVGSAHASVLEDLKMDFADPVRGESVYIPNCGGCHSGSVRQALVDGSPLPEAPEASAVGITCTTCHDPHENHVWTNVISGVITTNQLLYPTASLEDYHTSGAWATNNNPSINVCAQCHNDRGAVYTTSSRPPHHSPQYNVMLGTVGILPPGWTQRGGYHGQMVEEQCVTCHMQTEAYKSESHPAVTGHAFGVGSYDACLECHLDPAGLVYLATNAVNFRIRSVTEALERWGREASPEPLRSQYGALAWEYENPGDLTEASASETPTAAEQKLIPDNIKKARFNLYVVYYDASQGVHNGSYAVQLLDAAEEWVLEEIDPMEALLLELSRVP